MRYYPAEYLGDTLDSLVAACHAGLDGRAGAGRHAAARARHARARGRSARAVYLLRSVFALSLALMRRMRPVAPETMQEVRRVIVFVGIALALVILDHRRLDAADPEAAREVRRDVARHRLRGAASSASSRSSCSWLTSALGVQVPANLLFSLAIVLLLGVTLHLSWELSQAEDEIRRVAEESAIARAEIEQLAERVERLEADAAGAASPGTARTAGTDRHRLGASRRSGGSPVRCRRPVSDSAAVRSLAPRLPRSSVSRRITS